VIIEDAVNILRIRAAGTIKRCHTNQHHGAYTVAEHVGQAICLLLALHPHPGPSVNLIRALAFHDHPELYTGDVPAPVKRREPRLSEMLHAIEQDFYEDHPVTKNSPLTDDEIRWLKGIDNLELYLWCRDQELLGNRHASIIAGRVLDYFHADRTPQVILSFVEAEREIPWRERCFE